MGQKEIMPQVSLNSCKPKKKGRTANEELDV